MVDQLLLPAITETIRQNEIGGGSAYVLSFARLGKSGASFGFMQGDTNVSSLARTILQEALQAAGVDAIAIARIVAAVSRPLPGGNPLNETDTSAVNAALSSAGGCKLVDQMDQDLLRVVLNGLDFLSRHSRREQTRLFAPVVNLYIAPWINMSGPPTLLNSWLGGSAVHGVPPPQAPTVNEENIVAYLQATAYFQAHPRNFAHFAQCVWRLGRSYCPSRSTALLPGVGQVHN